MNTKKKIGRPKLDGINIQVRLPRADVRALDRVVKEQASNRRVVLTQAIRSFIRVNSTPAV